MQTTLVDRYNHLYPKNNLMYMRSLELAPI